MTASTASNHRSAPGARRLIGRRAIVALAIGASATLGLSACGAGQIAQTSSQVSGITGSEAVIGTISLHDVQLLYPSQEGNRVQEQVYISFTAVNESPVDADTLESITVNGQEFTLADGPVVIAPNSAVTTAALASYDSGGSSDGGATSETTTSAPTSTASEPTTTTGKTNPTAAPVTAETAGIPSTVTPAPVPNANVGVVGESVPVVFTFANAGEATLSTPIAVWHDVPRHPKSEIVVTD